MTEAPTISAHRPAMIGPGRFIVVVGPSGVGKDTLIGLARVACANDGNVVFPRRLVTREASPFEDNEQMNLDAFRQARARGDFAVHWEAHGHCYALPRTIDDDIRAGRTVVANVSRRMVDAIRHVYADVTVVSITAPPEILSQRLAARARSSDGEIEHRLSRAVDDVATGPDVTIANVGSVEEHARELVHVIKPDQITEEFMTSKAFETVIAETSDSLVGPWRRPHQMLNAQVYDSHASIHDDATAQKLGFQGGTIEGPTHFSQFAPLCVSLWGNAWFETGCISAHYRNPSFEGEEVQAILAKPEPGERQCKIQMVKRDGTEVLRGTASVGQDASRTALDQRLTELKPLADPVILRDVKVGMKTKRQTVRMDFDQNMGDLYPFSLEDKLKVITEPSPYYRKDVVSANPWGRPIIPIEMLSVLFQYRSREDRLPVRGPAVGLFADQEIRLMRGPLFAGEDYQTEREVVALSGSRRTESLWLRTTVFANDGLPVAKMLLNLASLKGSYAPYAQEHEQFYAQGA